MGLPVIDSVVRLLEAVFTYEMGSPLFNVMLGVCGLAWVIVARIFMAMFPTKRGIFAAFFAFIVPLLIGCIAYGVAELHVVPLVQADWAGDVLPWVGFGLFLFLAVILIAKRIMDLSAGVAIFVYIVATAAAVGAYFGAQVTIGVIEYGEGQVEQREQRVKDELDSLF